MSQVSTQILHQTYLLACPDGQENVLHEAAAQLDAAMQRHWQTGKLRLREHAAVLVAVNVTVENFGLRQEVAALRAQLQALQSPSTEQQALIARIDAALAHDDLEDMSQNCALPSDDACAHEAAADAPTSAPAAPAPEQSDAPTPEPQNDALHTEGEAENALPIDQENLNTANASTENPSTDNSASPPQNEQNPQQGSLFT